MSATDRERHPLVAVSEPRNTSGPFGIRPYVVLSPGRPVNAAGMRIDPPPSPPVASVHEAARDCRGRTAGRSAGRARGVPRVRGRTVQLREREVDATELAGGREPDQHRARGAQALHHRLVVRGDAIA